MRNIYDDMSMLCATKHTKCVFIYIFMPILTWNCWLRELNVAVPETDLVVVIKEQTLNNGVNESLRTVLITLFVIYYLKYCFLTKRIIIHKCYRIYPMISKPGYFSIILK